MKVYVDELPECCKECPCCNYCMDYGVSCNLADIELSYDFYADKRHENCPLQPLFDYTKQVRKEVCEEFKENIENIEKSIVNNPSYFDNEERKRLVEKAVYKNVFKFLDKEGSK